MNSRGTEAEVGDRIAGTILLVTGVLIPFGMLHHPTHVTASHLSPLHGALIALLLGSAYGFAHLVLRLGIIRPHVLGGVVLYSISVVANLLAGTINGFVVPRLAAIGPSSGDLALLWEVNQALVQVAVITAGTALILWGTAFAAREDVLSRVIFVAGIVLGAVPAALLLAGVIRMDVNGALLAYASQASWGALVGWLLLGGRLVTSR